MALRGELGDQAGRSAFLGNQALPLGDRDDPQPPRRVAADREAGQVGDLRAEQTRTGRRAAAPPPCRRRAGRWPARDTSAPCARCRTRSPPATGTGQATGTRGRRRGWAWSWRSPARSARRRSGPPSPAPPRASAGSSCRSWTAPCRAAAGSAGRSETPTIGCLPPLTSQYLAPGPSRASRWPSMDRWNEAQESSRCRHRQNAVARSARGPRPSIASSSDQPKGVCPITSLL